MDNKLVVFAILAGMMLLLGCFGQADTTKTASPAPAPAAKTGTGGASAFPPDITNDAGFNDTYADLNAVQ